MNEEATGAVRDPAKDRRDRMVKIGFLVVGAVLIGLVYYNQRNPAVLQQWSDDLDGTLQAARAQNRRTIVLFLPSPLGEHDRQWLVGNTIAKNELRIDKGGFLRVKVPVADLKDSPPARTYGIKEIPTILMLGADGKELKRLQGTQGQIAETDLTAFLVDSNSPAR
jgi:hypothetical protein